MNKEVKQGLDVAGIEIPFPQRVVKIKYPKPANPAPRRRTAVTTTSAS